MKEHSGKPLGEIAYCYLGDARNNMGNSLLEGGVALGMDVRLVAPRAVAARRVRRAVPAMAADTGARITLTDAARKA